MTRCWNINSSIKQRIREEPSLSRDKIKNKVTVAANWTRALLTRNRMLNLFKDFLLFAEADLKPNLAELQWRIQCPEYVNGKQSCHIQLLDHYTRLMWNFAGLNFNFSLDTLTQEPLNLFLRYLGAWAGYVFHIDKSLDVELYLISVHLNGLLPMKYLDCYYFRTTLYNNILHSSYLTSVLISSKRKKL